MNSHTVYDRIRNRTKPETNQYVQKNLAIVTEISRLIKEKGWTQKEFAKKMGKTESAVSKWLSGLQHLASSSSIGGFVGIKRVFDQEIIRYDVFYWRS